MPPKPSWVEAPHRADLAEEPKSGVFKTQTGRTRQMVKWGAIIVAVAEGLHLLFSPIIEAAAERIHPSPEQELIRALLKERREKDGR